MEAETRIDAEIAQDKYTKFEKARIIGARALQLSMGAPMAVELSKTELEGIRFNTLEIAKMEYDQGVVPIIARRDLPSQTGRGKYAQEMASNLDAKPKDNVKAADDPDTDLEDADDLDVSGRDDDEDGEEDEKED